MDKSYLDIDNSEIYYSPHNKNEAGSRARMAEKRANLGEINKQKFVQKNLSFAIIQSENAMSVNSLSQQNLAQV